MDEADGGIVKALTKMLEMATIVYLNCTTSALHMSTPKLSDFRPSSLPLQATTLGLSTRWPLHESTTKTKSHWIEFEHWEIFKKHMLEHNAERHNIQALYKAGESQTDIHVNEELVVWQRAYYLQKRPWRSREPVGVSLTTMVKELRTDAQL